MGIILGCIDLKKTKTGGILLKKSLGAKTITYPTPVFVVGTYDVEGKPNVMTAAWGGISCSDPPCISISLREATYTYHSIWKVKPSPSAYPLKIM